VVSAAGGSPQQLLPEDLELKQDPDWSPAWTARSFVPVMS
jgi:hypothetical protein